MGIQLILVQFGITQEGDKKTFNGEAALLFRACFHIEGDWRPFEDGILWENEGPPHPLKIKYIILLFSILCNITYQKIHFITILFISATSIIISIKLPCKNCSGSHSNQKH
jgi:hypothetical protein